MDIADAVRILDYLFENGPIPICTDSCDSNDDGFLNIADAVYSLEYLFVNGAPPAEPFPSCGEDASLDTLGCVSFAPCP